MTARRPIQIREEGPPLPRGFAGPFLLLLLAERPSHGYDLLERFAELGAPSVDPGTLYRALREMERRRLVASRWEASASGPARRTYRLTRSGERELKEWVARLGESQRIVAQYLRRYEALAGNR